MICCENIIKMFIFLKYVIIILLNTKSIRIVWNMSYNIQEYSMAYFQNISQFLFYGLSYYYYYFFLRNSLEYAIVLFYKLGIFLIFLFNIFKNLQWCLSNATIGLFLLQPLLKKNANEKKKKKCLQLLLSNTTIGPSLTRAYSGVCQTPLQVFFSSVPY